MIESVTFTPVTLIFKTEFDTEVNYHDAKHLWFALTVVFDQYHRQPICECRQLILVHLNVHFDGNPEF